MRWAICNELFEGWQLERVVELIAQCGYQGIEFAPFTLAARADQVSPAHRRQIRSLVEKAGLETVGLHWLLAKTEGFYLTSPDEQVRRHTAEYFGHLARLCADLGGKLLVLGSPKQRDLLPGVSARQATDYAADVIGRVLPVLEQTQVTLALEPLGPQETTFMVTTEETVALARRIDSPWVRLHLDVKAMATESVPIPELIRRYASLLAHFHANDTNLQGPGFGKVDFVPIFRALREIDYRGWVSVEVFDYSPGAERLARESIEYMKRCLAEVSKG